MLEYSKLINETENAIKWIKEYFEKEEKTEKGRKKVRLPWGVIATLIAMAVLLGLVTFVFRFTEILGFGNNPNHTESSGSEISESIPEGPGGYLLVMPNFVGRMRSDVENNSQYSDFEIIFEEENNGQYVEGMIFDDYFYPSGGTTEGTSAPDYDTYQSSGTTLSMGDWRRANVNQMVKDVYDAIQATRPDVRFGISPVFPEGDYETRVYHFEEV